MKNFPDEKILKLASVDRNRDDVEDSIFENSNNSHNVDEKVRIRTASDLVTLLVDEASGIKGTKIQNFEIKIKAIFYFN